MSKSQVSSASPGKRTLNNASDRLHAEIEKVLAEGARRDEAVTMCLAALVAVALAANMAYNE
jgi:hypothetical protein